MQNVIIPQNVNILEILNNKTSFSPHNYKKVILKAEKVKPLKEFVQSQLIQGEEVGSDSYISKSYKYFIRNKALQTDSFIFNFSGDCVVPILPDRFIDLNLKEGELIISKDSNW
jgi:type I restriction enzyme S subunit